MSPEDKLELPPTSTLGTESHGQLLYALGLLNGELKGMRIEMQGLKEAKVIQNGRVGDLEKRMNGSEKWQSENNGEQRGKKFSWQVAAVVISVIFSILGLIIKFVK